MLSFNYNRTANAFADVNVGEKNHNFYIPLTLDKYNIMIVMQKLKFMQECTFAINVECLQSSLQAKLQMHNCAHAKHALTCFCSIYSSVEWEKVHIMHIYKSNKYRPMICRISQKPRDDSELKSVKFLCC